jgi:hypothetical protein
MTALEACDKIEEAISDLHEETKDSGWDWSFTDILTDEQHLANHAESLAKTRAFFEIEDKTTMWFVSANSGNSLLALCGNSPTAQSRSRYISWANPQNLSLLISRLRTLEAQLSLALELLEKADYAIGYVLDVRELKCMHPGRAVDDCCAVCLINKWRVRLDASGLLGEIGGTK